MWCISPRPHRVGVSPDPSRWAVKPSVERAATPERNSRLSIVSCDTRPSRPGILELLLRAPALTMRSTRPAPAPPRRPPAPAAPSGGAAPRGQHDRVLQRHRRALAAARRRGVCGIADEDQAVPRHQSARAAGRRCCRRPAPASPAATSSAAGPASSARRSDQPALPLLRGRRGALVAADLRARDVDEPHDVAGGRRVRAEEGAAPEDEVPRPPGRASSAERGAAGDAAEVGQPDVAARRRRGVDGRADPRAHAVGRRRRGRRRRRDAVREGDRAPPAVVVDGDDLGAAPDVRPRDARPRRAAGREARSASAVSATGAVVQGHAQRDVAEQATGGAVHRVRRLGNPASRARSSTPSRSSASRPFGAMVK